jgi:hypothetical protein
MPEGSQWSENFRMVGEHTTFLSRANALISVSPHPLTNGRVGAISSHYHIPMV